MGAHAYNIVFFRAPNHICGRDLSWRDVRRRCFGQNVLVTQALNT